MISKLFTWAKSIAEGWKIFFGLIGMVAIIGTTAIKFDHWRNRSVINDIRIDRWIRNDSIAHIDNEIFRSIIITKFKGVSDSIQIINKGVMKSNKVLFNLQDYMQRKVATKEGLLEIQDIFNAEKKNDNSSSSWTP